MDALSSARWFAAQGCSVIPIDHPDDTTQTDPSRVGKTPVVAWKSFQAASPTDGELVAWFGTGRLRNLGVVTGAVSNLVVIDCDSTKAVEWAEAHFRKTNWRVRTSQGEHWGFRHPGAPVANRVRIRTGDPAIKIDVRGDGGYVVAPGSKHRDGTTYQWVGEPPEIASLPVFDPAWLGPADDPEPPAPVCAEPATTIPEGRRNDTLFREGCRLRQMGLSEDMIFAALSEMNRRRCESPLDPREVATIARSCASRTTDGDRFPLTEVGDAEAFAERYAGKAAYDARRGRWLLADANSGLWLPDPVEQLRGLAVDTVRVRQRSADEIANEGRRKAAQTWARKGESTTRLNNLLREARTQPTIRNDSLLDPWDGDPALLGVPGGVVDLRTGTMRRARPEERVTMRAGVDYDPAARSALWENALREISDDDPDWVAYLQRLGGYTATGDASQDKWFIKHGQHGREGKGTIDGAWTGALGDYALELPSAVFEIKPRGNPDFDLVVPAQQTARPLERVGQHRPPPPRPHQAAHRRRQHARREQA